MSAVFARHPLVERVVLYGSRAKGCFKPGSDIDLSIYAEGLSPGEKDRILDELDDLDLPYVIDLNIFDRLTNEELRRHIERVGVVFYRRA
jgi:predicted nucleotidyltransferase